MTGPGVMTNNRFAPLLGQDSVSNRPVLANKNGREASAQKSSVKSKSSHPAAQLGKDLNRPGRQKATPSTVSSSTEVVAIERQAAPAASSHGNSSFITVSREKRGKVPRSKTFGGGTNSPQSLKGGWRSPQLSGQVLQDDPKNSDQSWRTDSRKIPGAEPPRREKQNESKTRIPRASTVTDMTTCSMDTRPHAHVACGPAVELRPETGQFQSAPCKDLSETNTVTQRIKALEQAELIAVINEGLDGIRLRLSRALGVQARAADGTTRQKIDQVNGMVREVTEQLDEQKLLYRSRQEVTADIARLEATNSALRAEINTRRSQQPQEDFKTLNARLLAQTTEIVALEEAKAQLGNEISSLKASLSDKCQQIDMLSKDSKYCDGSGSERETGELHEELKGLRYTIRQLRSDRAGLKEGASTLKSMLDRANDSIQKLEVQQKSSRSEIGMLEASLESKEEELGRMLAKHQTLEEEIKERCEAPSTLVDELKRTKQALEEMREQKSNADVATFKGIHEMSTSLSSMVARNDMLHSKLQEAVEARAAAEKMVSGGIFSEDEVKSYRQVINDSASLRLRISELERDLKQSTLEKEECCLINTQQSATIQSQQAACTSLAKKIERLETSKNDLESVLEGAMQENAVLSARLQEMSQRSIVGEHERQEQVRKVRDCSNQQGSFLFGALKGFFPRDDDNKSEMDSTSAVSSNDKTKPSS